ncbi:hypothetical protein [Acetobacterium wieringae]|uniref:hypothetical protein n=1 Tax=Acetobacterium wieringae TaxID=52694 RepID=UPI0026EE1322|nr:hypothetical protein [Acetobacterium wieringae]
MPVDERNQLIRQIQRETGDSIHQLSRVLGRDKMIWSEIKNNNVVDNHQGETMKAIIKETINKLFRNNMIGYYVETLP